MSTPVHLSIRRAWDVGWNVRLRVGNQGFTVLGSGASKREALWMRRMLRVALLKAGCKVKYEKDANPSPGKEV